MARITSDKFAGLLKNGDIIKRRDAVYLLYGKEPKRISEAAHALKNAIIPELGGEDNYFRYLKAGTEPDEADIRDVIAQLNTVSMFGGGKLVWLGLVNKVDRQMAEPLISYAKNPNPQSTLIITVSVPKESWDALAAFEKSAFLKELTAFATVVRFSTPNRNELNKWLLSRMHSSGLSIGHEAAALLIELCGHDSDRLDGEIVKLTAYAGDKKEVTLEDVEEAVGDYRTENIWGLTKAFGRLDLGEAQAALSNLLENNTPAQAILKILTIEIMRIAAALDHRLHGRNFSSFCAELGSGPFPLKDAWANSDKWTPDLARRSLRGALKAYMDIMRGGVSPETSLQAMLVEILSPAAERKTLSD